MTDELKHCPFCKRKGEINDIPQTVVDGRNCGCWADNIFLTKDEWQSRPIEDKLNARIAELEAQLADVKAKRDTLMGCFFEYETVAPNGELMASVLDMHKRILELETQVKERDALIERLVTVGEFFSGGFEHDIFGVLANGNEAYGHDEGVVRGNEFLEEIQNRLNAIVSEWQAMKGTHSKSESTKTDSDDIDDYTLGSILDTGGTD